MATLRDIRNKISAVKKTQQITKAMNMVSAAKLRGAQQRMEGFRPYAQAFNLMLGNMAGRVEPEIHPFFQQAPEVTKVGLVFSASQWRWNPALMSTRLSDVLHYLSAGRIGRSKATEAPRRRTKSRVYTVGISCEFSR